MESFKVKNLSFCYPNRTEKALEDINFTVNQGEFVLVCGKSGCGKTTVGRIVAKKLGYRLDYFKLSITGASMKLEEDEFFLNDEILVASAGPIFNLFVFVICLGSWWINPVFYNFTVDFAYINFFIFLLNILPIYSLDGGRIFVCIFEKEEIFNG